MCNIERKFSICGLCGRQCGVEVEVANNRILSVQRPNHPYLPSALCVKGAALKQYVHHKERIQHPMKRIGPKGSGQFAPITWDEAFDIISRSAMYSSCRCTSDRSSISNTEFDSI